MILKGNYIRRYESESSYQSDRNGAYYEPWLSCTLESNNRVNYNKSEEEILWETPLTFVIESDGEIKWSQLATAYTTTNIIIYYSKNGEAEIPINCSGNGVTIQVTSGDVVTFKGTNQYYGGTEHYTISSTQFVIAFTGATFSGTTCGFSIKGNIMSLINRNNYTDPTLQFGGYKSGNDYRENAFTRLFAGCTGLTDASKLILPTFTKTGCYRGMFIGCVNLKKAPVLKAQTLTEEAYQNMFFNCTSLNYINCQATDISATNCLSNWTSGITGTGLFVKDSETTFPTGASGIPDGWRIRNL